MEQKFIAGSAETKAQEGAEAMPFTQREELRTDVILRGPVVKCPQCGEDHDTVVFTPLAAPQTEGDFVATHAGVCPVKAAEADPKSEEPPPQIWLCQSTSSHEWKVPPKEVASTMAISVKPAEQQAQLAKGEGPPGA